jgi:hypothetical protein
LTAEERPSFGVPEQARASESSASRLAFRAKHPSPPPALIAATVRRVQRRASAVTTLPLRAISPRAAIAASGSAPRAAGTRPKAASRALGSVIRNTAGGVVQRDRMPALQDVSETTLLCTTQSGHPGARRTTAEDRHEGDDAQRAPVMPGVPGAGIGAVVEGGQE